MIYIYDILLNWQDSSNLIEFFEWQEIDEFEHIRKIPLIKVEEEVIKALFHHHIKIEEEFLQKIKNKTTSFYKGDKTVVTYAVLFSDGRRSIALEFNDIGKSIYKSSLLLDEEEEVCEMVGELTTYQLTYKKESSLDKISDYTRCEKKDLELVLKKLKKLNKEGIDYLYEEYFNNDTTDKYQALKEEVLKGKREFILELKEFFNIIYKKV